jgi:hypothetical protein
MVTEVRFLYAPFRYFLSGHVCLVFVMANGQEVVVSPEAQTEKFIPLLGLLPFYRLHYLTLGYDEYMKKYKKDNRIFTPGYLI